MPHTTDQELVKKTELLIRAIENVYPDGKKMLWRSFLHGLFVGLGTTVGVSLVLAIVTFTLSQLRVIPGIDILIRQSNVEKMFPGP